MAFLKSKFNQGGLDQEEINKALGISSSKNVSPDELEVHTMQEDLALAQNPSLRASYSAPKHAQEANLSQKQKSSPFFKAPEGPDSQQDAGKITDHRISERPYASPTRPMESSQEMSDGLEIPSQKSGWLIAGVVLIVAALLGGGYYYWTTTRNNQEIIGNTPDSASSQSSQAASAGSGAVQTPLSTSSANYMQLDINADGTDVRSQGRKYVQLVKDGNYSTPVEFLPTDMSNNPVPLDTFLEKMDLVLPPAIRADMGTAYSMFVFNDAGKQRLGLKIASNDDAKLRIELSKEEPSLVKYTRSLLLGWTIPPTSSFAGSTYKDAAVRYTNINEANNLSIDYTVLNGNFLIGTSKMTLRSIIDYLQK